MCRQQITIQTNKETHPDKICRAVHLREDEKKTNIGIDNKAHNTTNKYIVAKENEWKQDTCHWKQEICSGNTKYLKNHNRIEYNIKKITKCKDKKL